MEMHCSEEYLKMEMESETNKYIRKGRLCSRQTGMFVLLGSVCMIIFMVLIFVILQAKKLSSIETLMTDIGSPLSSLALKQEENLQKLERHQNESYTEVKRQMDSLTAQVSSITSKLTLDRMRTSDSITHTQNKLDDMSSSVNDLKSLLWELRLSVQSLTYKLSLTKLLDSGCRDPDWILFSNNCYLFSRDRMNWTEAKDYCEEKGAVLLKIEDGFDEWRYVIEQTKPFTYWIGLTDQSTGQWRWVDETPYIMNKENWRPGQPDDWTEHGLGEDGEEGEDCVEITYNGLFNDAHCSTKSKFICKTKK